MQYYVGVDVSKAKLDIHIDSEAFVISNDKAGFKMLATCLKRYQKQGHTIATVVCEASGGYEKPVMEWLRLRGFPTHVAHANKVKAFARSKGLRAKTDPIDAFVIYEYAHVMAVKPDEFILSKAAQKVSALVKRRDELLKILMGDENRLEKGVHEASKRSLKSHIKWLKKEIGNMDQQLKECLQDEEIKAKYDLLTSVKGVGPITAFACIAYLPELGKLSHKKIAALCGVAPYNRDSGKSEGYRFIQGGRGQLRRVLYMAAVAASRFNPDLKVFYQRLKCKGKLSKVALTAVVRKLLAVLNSIIARRTPWVESMAKVIHNSTGVSCHQTAC